MATEVVADLDSANMIDYRKKAMDVLRAELGIHMWGLPYMLEKNSGKNVRATRFDTLAPATTPLTEAVPPTDTPVGDSVFEATLAQYGALNTFSDMLEAVGLPEFMEQQLHIFGIQAGETLEKLDIIELVANSSVLYANGSDANNFSGADVLTGLDFRRMDKVLTKKKVRGMLTDKMFRAAIDPDCKFDMVKDPTVGGVVDLQKRTDGKEKWENIVAKFGKTLIFESQLLTQTAITNAQGVTQRYNNLVMGYGHFAAYGLKGMPMRMNLIPPSVINHANPLGQKGIVGWIMPYTNDVIGTDGPRGYVLGAAASEPTL